MTRTTRLLALLMIATYFGFFVVEAVLWSVPWVHDILLPQLNPGLGYSTDVQVEVLSALFINQGAYNLLLGIGGLHGLRLWSRGDVGGARLLLSFLCVFAVGAALTLLATTHAYLLGVIQLTVPIILLPLIARDARHPRT